MLKPALLPPVAFGQRHRARSAVLWRTISPVGATMAPPLSLRYAPALRRPNDGRGPAMIARIDSADGGLIGVHRTWIDRGPDGIWRRRDRAMLGALPVARYGSPHRAKPC